MSIVNRLKLEGHRIHFAGVVIQGVCHSRQTAIEVMEKEKFEGNLCLRIDDDTIPDSDYIEKLVCGIEAGYDLVSGCTPHCASPEVMRETRFIKPLANRIILSDTGEVVEIGDDQALTYDTSEIVPIHHFRSSALYKKELHTKAGINYKFGLSNVGFREETWISIKAILAGYKLGFHTGAKYYHLQTPSGGCRWADYGTLVNIDEQHFRNWIKRKFQEKGNFLKDYEVKTCPQ